MPARLVITATAPELADLFGLYAVGALTPRYNVAPSHDVPVVRVTGGARELVYLRWGLIPHWNSDPAHEGFVNARSETVAEKPSFRDAFCSRRCLVPANGFYGWKPGKPRKQPYLFRPAGGGVFACAAVWDSWHGPAGPVETVSVLTMPSNELVMPTDPRIPVVVGVELFAACLDPTEKQPAKLIPLLEPYPAARMECWPVSTRVNAVANDGPDLIVPIPDPTQPTRAPTLFDEE